MLPQVPQRGVGDTVRLGEKRLRAQSSTEGACRAGSGILATRRHPAHLLQKDVFVPVAHPDSRTIQVLRHRPCSVRKPASQNPSVSVSRCHDDEAAPGWSRSSWLANKRQHIRCAGSALDHLTLLPPVTATVFKEEHRKADWETPQDKVSNAP